MGCDIHPYIEYKMGDEWYLLGVPEHGRNYELFGFLSGVRGDGQFFETQDKLPEDASEELQLEHSEWGTDAHSLTVIPTVSAMRKFAAYVKQRSEREEDGRRYTLEQVQMWMKMMNVLKEKLGCRAVRMVLWYDN